MYYLGQYNDIYKKKINVFEDYLSAPSLPFKLTHLLDTIDYKTFNFIDGVFSFQINKAIENNKDVQYRCIFLVDKNILFNQSIAELERLVVTYS